MYRPILLFFTQSTLRTPAICRLWLSIYAVIPLLSWCEQFGRNERTMRISKQLTALTIFQDVRPHDFITFRVKIIEFSFCLFRSHIKLCKHIQTHNFDAISSRIVSHWISLKIISPTDQERRFTSNVCYQESRLSIQTCLVSNYM